MAALLMLLLGFGIPLFVVWKVWSIANANKLSDSRMLDLWGALYDVYRAPAANGAPTLWSSKVLPNKGDVKEKEITEMNVKLMRDKIALHYLAVEMVQKVLVVMSALPESTGGAGQAEASAACLAVIYFLSSILVAWAQPFRQDVVIGRGRFFRVANALNRADAVSHFLQVPM